MPELTTKLGIKKPLGNETVSRAAFNENWDIIDANAQKNIIQSNTAPASPVLGDLWIDTSTTPNSLKKYNGTDWDIVGAVTPEQIGAVKNNGNVPSIQAGLDADKPTAGTAGRLYIATDTQVIYRDTGTAWQKVGAVKWGDIDGKPTSFTPSAHKSTHATGGADALTPADIGAPSQTTQDKTIYVDSTNGNDSNPGTQQQPFKTINKAISVIPQVVNHTITINVMPGTYNEIISLSGFTGKGTIQIKGAADTSNSANYIINPNSGDCINILSCEGVQISISGFYLKIPSGDRIYGIYISCSPTNIEIYYCTIDGQSYNYVGRAGMYATWGGICCIHDSVINNIQGSGLYTGAIVASDCGEIVTYSNTGSNNNISLVATNGIIRKTNSTIPNATTATAINQGGQILG